MCRIYTGTDNDKAMYYSGQAIQNAIKSKDALLIAHSQNRLGTICDYRGVIDSANINYLAALKIFETFDDKSGIAMVYQNIGVMYYFQNDLDKAKDYYLKAIHLRTETNELDYIAKLQNNIAVIFRRQKKYNQAIDFYHQALAIKLKFSDQEAIANAYSNLAEAYSYKGVADSASLYLKKAITINEKINSKINLAGNYLQLAEINQDGGDLINARLNVLRSIQYATEAESNDILYNDYELLWNVDTLEKDFRSAVINKQLASEYKAKVFKDDKAKAIEKLNVLYETEKKDKEIVSLNAEQERKRIQRQFLILGLALTLLVLIVTAVYFKKVKNKNKLLSFQKRDIEDKTALLNQQATEIAQYRTQMNPHFIFNALVTVQKFILKENKFNAAHYLTQLSKLMRLTLYNSEKEYITLKEEKEFLDFYIEFEHSRFENLFTYTFNLDDNVDEENILIPPMIIQPFIENAIKHGLSPKNGEGTIEILIKQETDIHKTPFLLLQIKDNGVGREAAKKQSNKEEGHRSKGLSITINRVRTACHVNKLDDANCVEIVDLINDEKEAAGTLVKIKLPLIENF